ncbi:hypothetical protein GJ744_007695 [Endocarpon pusillum]|uniref:Galactose oxidase-like Early set domain-containing protein n=1 Tax=Endocarpon pusillum TaxID=364733 RepID=A0A8H7ASP0_9EURO|nr:hypothetical protein GJ744_007695 [Endocarpon pusillum]
MPDPAVEGRWTPLFDFPNVVVHATLLPNGKVLHWGRRVDPTRNSNDPGQMDEHFTKSFLWTPAAGDPVNGNFGKSEPIDDKNQPTYFNPKTKQIETVNLFCSAHCLLPSGNLLVVGGHVVDGVGVEQASIFDYQANKWIPQTLMNRGRWYPSALALPDGRALCLSGSDNPTFNANNNNIPQIFPIESPTSTSQSTPEPIIWTEVIDSINPKDPARSVALDLYPALHIDPTNGQVFMAGPSPQSWFLEIKDAKGVDIKNDQGVVGRWTNANTQRSAGFCDYGPSVMYASGKIMYIGGGTFDGGPNPKTEFVDLTKKPVQWETQTVDLKTGRKQFNATVLPDGTVLVTGGHKGVGFNILTEAVHKAELMDPSVEPSSRQWTEMAAEDKSRCYHGTALLLPDGRVLSAGSGEAGGIPVNECHKEGQLFEPPYLHKGPRPTIVSCPEVIEYNKDFTVTVGTNDLIEKISLVRLGSVTHCRNMNQQLMFLDRVGKQEDWKVTIKAPANPNIAPPGHYMLFVLIKAKSPFVGNIPSVSRIVRIPPLPISEPVDKVTPSARVAHLLATEPTQHSFVEQNGTVVTGQIQPSIAEHNERVIAEQDRPHVAVGLTPVCPYGLGPCWGAAHDGLQAITDIDVVRPVPAHADCLAFVYLKEDIVPDIDTWRTEFESVANKGYYIRGIEMTLAGVVTKEKSGDDEQLTLASTSTRPDVSLAPFQASSQLKWDMKTKAPQPITEVEVGAYKGLVAKLADHPAGLTVQVTGTLHRHSADKYSLDVRDFEVS